MSVSRPEAHLCRDVVVVVVRNRVELSMGFPSEIWWRSPLSCVSYVQGEWRRLLALPNSLDVEVKLDARHRYRMRTVTLRQDWPHE